nr:serine protease [Kibdelosporangium phytohabitans]
MAVAHAAPASAEERIIGGEAAFINDFPFMLSLQEEGVHVCGAVIVSEKYALTTAHCTRKVAVEDLSVRVGSTKHGTGGAKVEIATVAAHPLFDRRTADFDIAALRFKTDLPHNVNVAEVEVAYLPPAAGDELMVAGWGDTERGGELAARLRTTTIPKVDWDECAGKIRITARIMCAGPSDGSKGICLGDSGGPGIKGGRLVGVISWSLAKCMDPHLESAGYTGFVDVTNKAVRDWIKAVTKV